MLIYRDSVRTCEPRKLLERLAAHLRAPTTNLDWWRDCCVELGELEAGVVDALCPQIDSYTPLIRALRRASGAVGSGFVAAYAADDDATARAAVVAARALTRVLALELPTQVTTKVAEGFAYYGLYPEQYVLAAQQAFDHYEPTRAVVLGLRSIGTALSSVVEATLARRYCEVSSYVLRPRGEPFARVVRWDDALEQELLRHAGAQFFIVDEGPGLSGSSLTCVARALARLGVPARRIAFLPSYSTDGAHFKSDVARACWRAHRHFVADFEPAWVEPAAPGATLTDLSASRWRQELGLSHLAHVSWHPQHERRKFLATWPDGTRAMLRFAGFGAQGQRVQERAEALGADGLAPRLLGASQGVLRLEYLEGTVPGQGSAELVSAVADYLARRRALLAPGAGSSLRSLLEMAQVNSHEGLGEGASEPLERLAKRAEPSLTLDTVVDGRMLLQEWLIAHDRFRKLDAWDHGDDHFYPGPCDTAWDLAGASVELGLGAAEQARLVDSYAHATGDRDLRDRLPFFLAAYLAFRLGYARMATEALAGDPAAAPFRSSTTRYAEALRALLLGEAK